MKVLMIDVGGNKVKLMVSGSTAVRSFRSGPKLTAQQAMSRVLRETRKWKFDAVTIGVPGLVANGRPAAEPINIGGGWVGFNFERALHRPVRVINDAAMQALAHYEGGRLLFVGLGTGVGSTLIVDDSIIPLELGAVPMTASRDFMATLSDERLEKIGRRKWQLEVKKAVRILQRIFTPTDTVLGGGNSKLLDPMPPGCRRGKNADALLGAQRLWKGADMLAEPRGSSWHIHRHGSW
jgi:polyphosphate glucokinase